MAKGKAIKLFWVLLTITVALVAWMSGTGEAQPDDPCLDDDCDADSNCQVGYECMEMDVNACGPGKGYCWNFCDYPCWTTDTCKAGWECIGLRTCNGGMGYCWRIQTVPTPDSTPNPCSDPSFHCSSDAECGGEGFICYGFQDNLCGPGLGYCTTAA